MVSMNVIETGGIRKCRPCGVSIPKGSMILVESLGGQYNEYNNYCPSCGLKMLRNEIKRFNRMEKELNEYCKWDR